MSDKVKTFAWEYFNKCENNEDAKCLKCSAIIKCKGGSTLCTGNNSADKRRSRAGLLSRWLNRYQAQNETKSKKC